MARSSRSRNRGRHIPDHSDLVSAVELEFILRQVFAEVLLITRNCSPCSGLVEQFGIRPQWKARRTSRRRANSVNSTGGSATWRNFASTARSTIAVQKAFHACAGLVFKNAGRRRKMAVDNYPVNQLFGVQNQSFLYGEYAPAG